MLSALSSAEQVLRTTNFRDIVPKIPGISEAELQGIDFEGDDGNEDDGAEYLGSLNIVGKLLKTLWRERMRHRYASVRTSSPQNMPQVLPSCMRFLIETGLDPCNIWLALL